MKQRKFGLALGSGGIKGLYHLGVIKGIINSGIKIDYIAGTSAGALIAAMYAATLDIEEVIKRFDEKKFDVLSSMLDPTFKGGFIAGNKVGKLLTEWLKVRTFEELKIPISVVATDLISSREVVFNSGEIIKPLQASMNVPILFKPIEYLGMELMDGGLITPVPDKEVRKMGAQVVLSVNLENCSLKEEGNYNYTKIRDTGLRAFQIIRQSLAENSIKNSDLILEPNIEFRGILHLNKYFRGDNKIFQLIDQGEKEVLDILPQIKNLLKN